MGSQGAFRAMSIHWVFFEFIFETAKFTLKICAEVRLKSNGLVLVLLIRLCKATYTLTHEKQPL